MGQFSVFEVCHTFSTSWSNLLLTLLDEPCSQQLTIWVALPLARSPNQLPPPPLTLQIRFYPKSVSAVVVIHPALMCVYDAPAATDPTRMFSQKNLTYYIRGSINL